MDNYKALLKDVMDNGVIMKNRTGTNTISVISRDLRWDLSKGFPAVTTKKLAWKAVVGELLWFLSGSNNIKDLRKLTEIGDNDFCIWQKNLDEYNARSIEKKQLIESSVNALDEQFVENVKSSLGYIYGSVWRKKKVYDESHNMPSTVDQISVLIDMINLVKHDPSHPAARRMIVDTWAVEAHHNDQLCALPPCHYGFQVFVRDGKLSLKWMQRSVDSFLGLPFNIASYALLTHILAKITGLGVGELIFSGGDVHIYEDHIEQVKEQISRESYELPTLEMPEQIALYQLDRMEFSASDFKLVNYKHHGKLSANMS